MMVPRFFKPSAFFIFLLFIVTTPSVYAGFIYALNTDSLNNHIYGFNLDERKGILKPLDGFPIGTGGKGKFSFAGNQLVYDHSRARLYALNTRSNTVNVYTVNLINGLLLPTDFSPIVLPAGSWSCLAVHPSGSPLVIGSDDSNRVLSYLVSSTKVIPATGSPFNTGINAISCTFAEAGQYLYLGGSENGLLAGLQVNTNSGLLTPLPGSPYNTAVPPNPVSATSGYTSDDQSRLFMVESETGKIKGFNLLAGVPTALDGLISRGNLSSGADTLIHPAGFLFISDRINNVIDQYRITGLGSSTTASAIVSTPIETGGSSPYWLSLNAEGNLLFVANTKSRNITSYQIDKTNGKILNVITQGNDTLGTVGQIQGLIYTPSIPTPTISANGKNSQIAIRVSRKPLTLAIGIDSGGWIGKATDWWLVHIGDNQLASFNIEKFRFVPGLVPTAQGPIISFDDFDFQIPLPMIGQHNYCLAVDSSANGVLDLDSLFFDCVEINILP
jgi:hypothetical protein